jgi:hypothetical protein
MYELAWYLEMYGFHGTRPALKLLASPCAVKASSEAEKFMETIHLVSDLPLETTSCEPKKSASSCRGTRGCDIF